jgi:hypothetical protein
MEGGNQEERGAARGSNSSTPPRAKRGACTPRFCHMVHEAAAADGGGFRAHEGIGRGSRRMVAGATAPRAGDDMAAATGRRGGEAATMETAGRRQWHGGAVTTWQRAASDDGGARRRRGESEGEQTTWITRLQMFRPPRQAAAATATQMGIRPPTGNDGDGDGDRNGDPALQQATRVRRRVTAGVRLQPLKATACDCSGGEWSAFVLEKRGAAQQRAAVAVPELIASPLLRLETLTTNFLAAAAKRHLEMTSTTCNG